MKGWKKNLLFIVPYFLTVSIFQLVGFYLLDIDFDNLDINKTINQQIIISFFSFLGTFFILYLFMRFIDKEPFVNIGFFKKINKEFYIGTLISFFLVSSVFIALLFLEEMSISGFELFFKDFLLTIILCLLVSITEEAVMRGYVLRNLLKSFNPLIALFTSSFVFSILHFFNPNIDFIGFFNIWLGGLLLGFCYIISKKIWLSIGLHFGWNFFQSFYGFKVSGIDISTFLKIKIQKNNILNGGEFGIEGSVIMTFFLSLFILYLFYKIKDNEIVNRF
jgi:membrane protease YdiL (CAAX protease family)